MSTFWPGLGDSMRRHAHTIQWIQWTVVAAYCLLLLIPPFLPLPGNQARIVSHLTLFAQFIFWGIWWPFVLLSIIFFGRIWCGVFCPEGTLTEWASHYSLRKKIPAWLKWSGWPAVAFALITLYGQLISVYDYALASLLILGGSTLAAMLVGYLFGKDKRVWCRYLCPVSGVFNLLARLAPLHYKVDEQRWRENSPPHLPIPNCGPLINIHHLETSQCHLCGRCSGQRQAISLQSRPMGEEIILQGGENQQLWDIRLLLFGIFGLALGAFSWTLSPWFIAAKQTLAAWLVDRDLLWPLSDNAPWWLLTHYPQNNDSFTWLDGFCIVSYLLLSSLLIGTTMRLLLAASGRCSGIGQRLSLHLAQALIPLGGIGLFLGLSATTVNLLKHNGLTFPWLQEARALLLLGAFCYSLWLGWKLLRRYPLSRRRFTFSYLLFLLSGLPPLVAWWLIFWGW